MGRKKDSKVGDSLPDADKDDPATDGASMFKSSKQIQKTPRQDLVSSAKKTNSRSPNPAKVAQLIASQTSVTMAPQAAGAGTPMDEESEEHGLKIDIQDDSTVTIKGRPAFTKAAQGINLGDEEHRRHVLGWADTIRPSCEKVFSGFLKNLTDGKPLTKDKVAAFVAEMRRQYKIHGLKRAPSDKSAAHMTLQEQLIRQIKYAATQLNGVVNNLNPGSGFENTGADKLRARFNKMAFKIAIAVRASGVFAADGPSPNSDNGDNVLLEIREIVRSKLADPYEPVDPTNPGGPRKLIILKKPKTEEEFTRYGQMVLRAELENILGSPYLNNAAKIYEVYRLIRDAELSTGTDISPKTTSSEQNAFALNFKETSDWASEFSARGRPWEHMEWLFSVLTMPNTKAVLAKPTT